MKESFVGEAISPEDLTFSVSAMAAGKPGLPRQFTWRGKRFSVIEVLEEWKECGNCHHGSGERYVRKHWFRVSTTDNLEMKIYFERQARSSGGSRWRLYSILAPEPDASSIRLRTASSILISGGQGRLKPSPGSLRVASIPSLVPTAISGVA